jgi:hypothetical protein
LRINPSDETIHLGPLAVRFLVAGEDSNGSVGTFELTVPGAQRLAAPAHSHDQYEETIRDHELVLGQVVGGRLLVPAALPMTYGETGNLDGSAELYPSTFQRGEP